MTWFFFFCFIKAQVKDYDKILSKSGSLMGYQNVGNHFVSTVLS